MFVTRLMLLLAFLTCLQAQASNAQDDRCHAPEEPSILRARIANVDLKLEDFFKQNSLLDYKVDSLFTLLTEQERVAQMIVAAAGKGGKDDATVRGLIANDFVGGVILMKGKKEEHKQRIESFNRIAAKEENIPLLYSMDAEPSLLKGRNEGGPKLGDTYKIKTREACDSIAKIIDQELLYLGVRQNFAPVVDISIDNAAIKKRSFGSDPTQVVDLCKQFITTTQNDGIIATAKHFPGHGLVTGDTHKQSVYINGELKELQNYAPLIKHGVLSIMVAHIVVRNNPPYETGGLPASLSRVIITNLLRKELGFRGLIVTDALGGMSAVAKYKKSALMASRAGSDLILMPDEVEFSVNSILAAMKQDDKYRQQVYQSVRRILRVKFCLGLLT